MKMKKSILIALLGLLILPAKADEGMWTPDRIASRIKEMRKQGFRLRAEDLYNPEGSSLKDAIVLFGGGCTGEIVSPDGLLLTNHHCGYSAIQKHSSVEHDYLTNGFWAMNRQAELPNPGLEVCILIRMEDVTDEVEAGRSKEVIEQACEQGRYKAEIKPIYYGNQHYLYVYEVFRDVRLVGAPPSSIGKFGGDTDNWMWPRHTGDFSVFRIYADKNNQPADYSPDNVPYRPKKYLPISTSGVKEDDFTFIYGFPGTTQEYIISDAVEYILNQSNPAKVHLRTIRLDIIDRASEKDPKTRIQYASKQASIGNAWKKWQGESKGLVRLGTIEKKRAYEAEFRRWAADKPAYASLLDSMHASYARITPDFFRQEYFRESIRAIELTTPASILQAAAKGKFGTNEKNRLDAFFKDYVPEIDRAIAARMIEEYLRTIDRLPSWLSPLVDSLGGPEAYADYLFRESVLPYREKLEPLLSDASAANEAAANDPFIRLLNDTRSALQLEQTSYTSNLSAMPEIFRWYKPYMQALMEFDAERPFYPDANLTLRIAYGKVAGYDYADAVRHKHVTTLEGIIEKDNPEIYDYDIPDALRRLYAEKDYGAWGCMIDGKQTVPVAFIATNHTTGGNSGSPVLNAKGELLGLNFDRTWLSTMSDIEFDPTICRNIAVDIRYVLFVIDKIGGASYLFDEMDIR